ncbi:MAG: DUF3604 domain-containing protein, partial [Myxococcota bacterium]
MRTSCILVAFVVLLAQYGCSEDTSSNAEDDTGSAQTDAATDAALDTSEADTDNSDTDTSNADADEPDTGGGPDAPLVTYTQDQEPCEDRHPNRRAYFGDLHVHTSYSFDAYAHETRNDPFAAYDFARGEKVCIGELSEGDDGVIRGRIPFQLREPLDFTAVTDHSEMLGEVVLCTADPESPSYNDPACVAMREEGSRAVGLYSVPLLSPNPENRVVAACRDRFDITDPDNPCVVAAQEPWAQILRAAELANDSTSACTFTAF